MKHPFSDELCSPPALVIDVIVHVRGTPRQAALRGKIDTGADASVVPLGLLKSLRAPKWGSWNIEMLKTGPLTISGYLVDIELLGRRFVVKAVGLEQSYPLIGRDILNQLSLTIDGPNEEFLFHPPK